MNHTDTVIFTVDMDLKLLAFNSSAEKFFREAFNIELTTNASGEPGEIESIPQVLLRFILRGLNGEEIKLEQEFSLNGKTKRYKALYSPISDEIGLIGCNLFLRDITNWWEKQKLEEARYRDIFESVYDAIVMLDADGNVNHTNQAGYNLFGIEPGTSFNLKDLILRDDLHKATVFFNELATKGFYSGYQGKIRNHAGEVHYIEVNSVAIFDERGEFKGSRNIIRDITENKLAEIELEEKNRNLEKTNQELDNFVYRAAHDMRAPVASVLGLMSLMENSDSLEEIQGMLKMGHRSLQKLESFIRDIVDYSRNKRTEVEPQLIDVQKVAANSISQLQHMEGADKIRIEVEVKGEEPFYSDPKRVGIIFNNLISNAIRYADHSKSDPLINISARHLPETTQITISDNGRGIPEEHLEKIFRMFYRAHTNSKGTGIGLYITQETVEKLGGEISVDSSVGVGTTFRIQFPNTPEK